MSNVIVRVMASGREVDRITRPLRMLETRPAVTYRKVLWPVTDGCIHIDAENLGNAGLDEASEDDWEQLVARLLPSPLPVHISSCREVLQSRFRSGLTESVIESASWLVASGKEWLARELITDFLREKHDSERLRKLIRMQLLFDERTRHTLAIPEESGLIKEAGGDVLAAALDDSCSRDEIKSDASDWSWLPDDGNQLPDLDDRVFRKEAERLQENIGSYRAVEAGANVPDLGEELEGLPWEMISDSDHSPHHDAVKKDLSPEAQVLMQRTMSLSQEALELLRYFAGNPGDRIVHAQQVLGYPVSSISKLLSGSLSHYLKRNESGGWECHPWVGRVLELADERQ